MASGSRCLSWLSPSLRQLWRPAGSTPLSRIGVGALVARLMHRMNTEGRLTHYESVAATPGFPRAVAGVITELRLARILRGAIGACAPDLEPLIDAYEVELKEAGLIDWPGVLALASEVASAVAGKRPRLIGLPMLLLDVPVRNEAELVLVDLLTAAAAEVLATVPSADQASLRHLAIASARKSTILTSDLLVTKAAPPQRPRALSPTSSADFSRRKRVRIEAKPDDTVEVFSAPGEGRECVEIARRVLSVARDGVPFDRVAVLLRSPDGYRAYLEEAFNRAGIPAHFARGAVRPDPAGRAFCALLKCAADGLSARRFAECLSLGQVPDATPDGAPPEAIPGGRTLGIPRFRVCSILD